MQMQTTFNTVYSRLEDRLDHSVTRLYQPKLPACVDDMFGTFLLSDNPKELVRLTPANQIPFHIRVPVLTLSAVNIIHNLNNARNYDLPDINWHLNSISEGYQYSLERWIQWTQETAGNYRWMRQVFLGMLSEMSKNRLNINDSSLNVINSAGEMAKKYKSVSGSSSSDLQKFPTNIRISRAKLIANRWPYAQYKNAPDWWPYPKALFKQEHFSHIDKVKKQLISHGKIIVLDQAPDITFTPPPITVCTKNKNCSWDDYDWKAFVKNKGDWHKVYEYDQHWLQRLIR